jgi:hypothetical protein
VPAGDDRGACRRPQGAHRSGRWLPRVDRVVGDLLRNCKRRGMAAPVLAALPKSTHPGAKKALADIWNAEDKRHALDAVTAFQTVYGAKFPKATAKITDDRDELVAFFDYPAEHWIHLHTTNPIESTFATVRHRTKVTKGRGSRVAGLAMAFKLIESAQDRWRAVNTTQLVAVVRAGALFIDGKLVERPDEPSTPSAGESQAPHRPPTGTSHERLALSVLLPK